MAVIYSVISYFVYFMILLILGRCAMFENLIFKVIYEKKSHILKSDELAWKPTASHLGGTSHYTFFGTNQQG